MRKYFICCSDDSRRLRTVHLYVCTTKGNTEYVCMSDALRVKSSKNRYVLTYVQLEAERSGQNR